MVVKLVKKYGTEVHKSLASAGMAPHICDIPELPGGWKAIIMDKVEGKTLCDKSLHADGKVKFAKFKAEVLHHLQHYSFVYGDLQPQNIFCSTYCTFFAIDFDWAGKVKTARYPIDINMKVSL